MPGLFALNQIRGAWAGHITAARTVLMPSHPKVAAKHKKSPSLVLSVSTHSHPKVAAGAFHIYLHLLVVSTHSHPKVAGISSMLTDLIFKFQHTTTRRWEAT